MTTLVPPDLKRKFKQTLYRGQFAGLMKAEIGIIDGAGNKVVDAPGRPGAVWVRIFQGSEIVNATALNVARGVSKAYGVKVWIGENAEGRLAIMGVREAEMAAEVGETAVVLAQPNVATSTLVTARQLKMGRVRPYGGLTVYIEPIHHAGGYWPGGTLDLSDYVPDAAGFQRWVKVGIDESLNQPVAYPGSLLSTALPLTEALLADVPFPVGVAYAGVKLAHGATALDKETQFADCTPWRSRGAGGSGSGTFVGLSDTPASYADRAGYLVVVNPTATGLEFVEPGGESGAWNPNLPPASPSAYDDEFDDDSVDAKWAEDDPSSKLSLNESGEILHLELAFDNGAGAGLWQDAPAGDWQTVVKITPDITGDFPSQALTNTKIGIAAQFSDGAICSLTHSYLFPASPPFFMLKPSINLLVSGSGYTVAQFIDATEFYLRLRYDSATKTFSGQYSTDGITWDEKTLSYGVAVEKIGLYASNRSKETENHVIGAEYDFFRVREEYGSADDPIYGNSDAPLAFGASQISYDPTDGSDWPDPDPANVQDALDALAALSVEATTVEVHTDDVSNPPTDAELDSAIGTPATVGAGYVALLDDGGAGSAVYLIASDSTNWWYTALTKAT